MRTISAYIDKIQPTQCSVGYAEVAVKMEELSSYESSNELSKYLKTKKIPCVLGADDIIYIIDNHHMCLALIILAAEWQEKFPKKNKYENPFIKGTFNIIHDFSKTNLMKKDFLKVLTTLNLTHKFNEFGLPAEDIPKRIIDLKNDPYRSLAGFVRKSGGFKKINIPYLEFKWADFFRSHINIEEINNNIKEAVSKGIKLALSDKAKDLPGWTGVEITKNIKPNYTDRINNGKAKFLNLDLSSNIESIKDSYSNKTKK